MPPPPARAKARRSARVQQADAVLLFCVVSVTLFVLFRTA
jgi:hypothetical protein